MRGDPRCLQRRNGDGGRNDPTMGIRNPWPAYKGGIVGHDGGIALGIMVSGKIQQKVYSRISSLAKLWVHAPSQDS